MAISKLSTSRHKKQKYIFDDYTGEIVGIQQTYANMNC